MQQATLSQSRIHELKLRAGLLSPTIQKHHRVSGSRQDRLDLTRDGMLSAPLGIYSPEYMRMNTLVHDEAKVRGAPLRTAKRCLNERLVCWHRHGTCRPFWHLMSLYYTQYTPYMVKALDKRCLLHWKVHVVGQMRSLRVWVARREAIHYLTGRYHR